MLFGSLWEGYHLAICGGYERWSQARARESTDDSTGSLMGYAKVKREMSTVEDGGYETM